MAQLAISKLKGELFPDREFRHVGDWPPNQSPLLINSLSLFCREFMILKRQLSILDIRIKQVQGILKKGQDRGALVKPRLSLNSVNLGRIRGHQIFCR